MAKHMAAGWRWRALAAALLLSSLLFLYYSKTECQVLKLPKRNRRKTVRKKIAVRDLFSTCVAPKGGSTSWYELREKLKQHRFEGNTQAAILSVRHPLSRLTSAYRDKFLNGSPISSYDAAWKNVTRSSQSWRFRWSAYWLPALVSRGDVEPSLWMDRRRHAMAVNMSDVCRSTLISNLAVIKQFERDYRLNMKKYISLFSNVTFSFEDFLRHVLWTFDHDIMDHHWAPQSCLCDPCGQHYDYILHLENIGQEARHVFDALGVPQEVQLGSDHDTKKALSVSENGYFDGIDKALMTRLYVLYKNDFNLFGYQY